MIDDLEEARLSFDVESLEKVQRIMEYLKVLDTHPAVKHKIALHGGTALNLFILPPARLSLDADLNYCEPSGKLVSSDDKEIFESAICDVADELGYQVEPGIQTHAGRTMKLVFRSEVLGARSFLKLDIDYMNRTPLLHPEVHRSTIPFIDTMFPINAPIEVVAGKVKAIASRVVPRDLFDMTRIARTADLWTCGSSELDHRILTYYLSVAGSFPKRFDILERFNDRQDEVEKQLWPVLPIDSRPTVRELQSVAEEFVHWTMTPSFSGETRYLEALSRGEYLPEILFPENPEIVEVCVYDPAMKWKMQNLLTGIAEGKVEPISFE